MTIDRKQLYDWCRVPVDALYKRSDIRIPFRVVESSDVMGQLMARELADEVKAANTVGRTYRVIVPCGPKCWYNPFTEIVNAERISLKNVFVFHMDECLDWQGRVLPANDPYNFRAFMEKYFYGGIPDELSVPSHQRFFPEPSKIDYILEKFADGPIDLTLGGFGQDGHIAYNQSRRHPFSNITVEELRTSSIRIQENNLDTIIALAHRTFGGAYQFVPPMSITLGLRECLSARKVRLFSDTGSWKQTAFRVALFSPVDVEYPITLLQEHPDALLTVTHETAQHPISQNPEWGFQGINV